MYKIKGQDQKEYGPVDAAQLRLWVTQGRADAQTLVCLVGTADWRPLGSFPEFAAVAASVPPPLPRPPSAATPDNAIATIIPYRNVPALVAYYTGVFSLIPCLGIVLGIAAVVLGVIGLKQVKQHPESKGKVHAWIGIIVGGISVLVHVAVFILFMIGAAHRR